MRSSALSPGDVDVCVIGSGASGAVAAHALVRAGLRVLLLEEGGRLAAGSSLTQIQSQWASSLVLGATGQLEATGRPWTARALGGGMALYAGISFRYRHVDFDARAHTARDALDPQWPIRYEDLRTDYDEIEALLGIARLAGSDPCEPEGRAALQPPHSHSAQGELLARAGRSIGKQPFPTPLAINSRPYGGRPRCSQSSPCNEYVCGSGARADVVSTLLDPLMHEDGFVLASPGRALKLQLVSPDRVGAVEWLDLGSHQRRTTKVRHVVLAANAIQSSALLLRSRNRWFPTGVGNHHDMVGRGLSFKISGYATGHVAAPKVLRGHLKGPHSTVSFSDHYIDPHCPTGLGGILYEASPDNRRVRDGRMALRVHYLASDQPMRDNRVRISSTKDEFGTEQIITEYSTHPVDVLRLQYLARKASELLAAADAQDVTFEATGYERGSRHLHGGCRSGDDPATSVTDRQGRVHGVDNISVVDGGVFPYAGGVNPTFTIQANALRITRQLIN